MNITAKFENNTLTIALEGSIDSVTAPEAEARITEFRREYPEGAVVLDAEKLNYISSSGLRVILRLRKQEGTLKLINVSSEIYEVLDITGFVDMMEVSRAMRTISAVDGEVLGQGSRGKVIRLNADTIVKVYLHESGLEEAKEEQGYARKAFVMGVPTAIPYDIVKCDGHYGLVFELVDTSTVSGFIRQHPETLEENAVKFAQLLKTLHTTHAQEGSVKNMHDLFAQYIDEALGKYLEPEELAQIKRINDAIPHKDTLIHGDFHPNNVMMQRGEDMILIDMADISSGNPIYDFGSMFIGRYLTNAERKEKLLGLPEEDYNRFFALALDAYLADKTPEQRKCFLSQAQVIMQLWFILFLRNSWAAVPTFIEKMYGIVRGRLLPNIEEIVALMAQDI